MVFRAGVTSAPSTPGLLLEGPPPELYLEAAATGLEATLVVENDHDAELNTKDDRCGAVSKPCGSDNGRSFDLIGKWNRPLESGVSTHESLLEYLENVDCIPADVDCKLASPGS